MELVSCSLFVAKKKIKILTIMFQVFLHSYTA